MAKALRSIHPNVFTWFSLVAAFVGGWAFWRSGPEQAPIWLLLGWGMVLVNSILDLLDGKVAKMTGKASPKGDYLDHSIDRFSDVLFIGGLSLSGWVDVRIGMVAIIGTLLTSYMGTQAQAIGIGRNYGGLLGRADRMVLMLIVPVAQYVWHTQDYATPWADWTPWGHTLLALMIVYIAVMGIITTAQRFLVGLRAFDKQGQLKP